MKTTKTSFTIAMFFLGLAVACLAQAGIAKPPDFSATDIAGQSLKLSDLKGKVVLLDFWATWCPPCRVVLSVSLDRYIPLARQFVKEKEMNWLHVIDRESSGRIASLYEIEYIPATFIIDGKGKIVARNLRGAELINTIASLLK
jgi:thiol-disulfide isomerase/thioredoxin